MSGALFKPTGRIRQVLLEQTAVALKGGLHQLVRRNLRGVWVRGDIPTGGAVWAANHHSWWDFFVLAAALRVGGRPDAGVLMEAANIGHRDLYRQVGAIGADQLRTAVTALADGRVLIVFPEGALRATGPLGGVHAGAGWLTDRAGVPLVPVALRVVLRGQQAAEAYVDIAPPLTADDDLADVLRRRLATLDAELAAADPERPLPGFTAVIDGVRSWNERIGALGRAR